MESRLLKFDVLVILRVGSVGNCEEAYSHEKISGCGDTACELGSREAYLKGMYLFSHRKQLP